MIRVPALLCVAALLAACSSHPAPADVAPGSSAPAPATTNALADTPLATYGHDLNRAKNVQKTVDDQAKQQAKAIDAATGGGH